MNEPVDISAGWEVKLTALFKGTHYTEGPVVDAEGNVYFTTLTGGKIMKLDPAGIASVWAETSCPNGQRILSNGDHLVCDSQQGKVIRFDPSGNRIGDAAAGACNGVLIRTPNDLAVDDGNGFYFTDSVRTNGAVYFFGDNGSQRIVARDLDYPNGICLSKDRKKLFVAESYRNRILVADIKEPGVPRSPLEVLCQLPINREEPVTGNLPDGILLDKHGRLWVAHYGMGAVHLISGKGDLMATYATGIPLTSNLCFIDDTHLVVTGGSGEPGPGNVNVLHFYESKL